MKFTDAERKALVVAPMITGIVSTIASMTLIITILNSAQKLQVPSRRILFGMCIYDVFYSIACALSTFPVPREVGIWGALGNITSCNFQG